MTVNSNRRNIERARALIYKISEGRSSEEMVSRFAKLIEDGNLALRKPPHPNTISNWINSRTLTPILDNMLKLTAAPFRRVEYAAMVDSTKMSQMRTAHARYVDYGDDFRETADWMKMHALVGVETSICMAASFSGSVGKGSADVSSLLRLVDAVKSDFSPKLILADKAYLSMDVIGGLHDRGIRGIIPVKKRWDPKANRQYAEPVEALIERYENRQPEFHGEYRFRVKIEAFFSMLKRIAEGYCWSRGRLRTDSKEVGANKNSLEPCTAWINEILCKLIYVNLCTTVAYEAISGYQVNYLADTFFPEIPDDKRLIA